MSHVTARFHFQGELTAVARGDSYRFLPPAAVKDGLEALGVPHTEVDRLLIDGRPSRFESHLVGAERVEVLPPGEPPWELWPEPPEPPVFVVDDHLGRLCRWLRLCGFDATLRTPEAGTAGLEGRVLLSRGRGVLCRAEVRHGCLIRSAEPAAQLAQVLDRYRLRSRANPFSRCLVCNALLLPVTRDEVLPRLPPAVRHHSSFSRCPGCGRIFWPGSHHQRMQRRLNQWLGRRQ